MIQEQTQPGLPSAGTLHPRPRSNWARWLLGFFGGTLLLAGLLVAADRYIQHLRGKIQGRFDALAETMRHQTETGPQLSPELVTELNRSLGKAEHFLDRRDYLQPTLPLPGEAPELRPLPYPFQTYVTVNSDPDIMRVPDCLRIHEIIHERYHLNISDQVFINQPLFEQETARWYREALLNLIVAGDRTAPADIPAWHRFLVMCNRGWIDGIHGWSSGPLASPEASFKLTAADKPVDHSLELPAGISSKFRVKYIVFEYRMPTPGSGCHLLSGDRALAVCHPLTRTPGLDNQHSWTPAFARLPDAIPVPPLRVRFWGPPGSELEARNLMIVNMCRDRVVQEAEFLYRHHVRFLSYSLHSTVRNEYGLGLRADLDNNSRLSLAGDNPVDAPNISFIDCLDRLGVCFINSAHHTAQYQVLPLDELIAPHGFNDGNIRYNYRRFMLHDLGPADAAGAAQTKLSLEPCLGPTLERLRKRSVSLGEGGVIYTHWGTNRSTDPLSPSSLQQLKELQDCYYNLSGQRAPWERVWVAPTCEILLLARALRGIKENSSYDPATNSVHIRSWLDPVGCQRVPMRGSRCAGLANLTFYVHDADSARVFIDGAEYTCFKRNPADTTGRPSITLVDDNVPTTVIDEVDPLQRHGDVVCTKASCYFRRSGAFHRAGCLEVQLDDTAGSAAWTFADITSANTSHFRFAYRKTNPASRVTARLAFEGGKEVVATETELENAAGWKVPARHDSGWHDVVLDYADLTWPKPGAWLPRERLQLITFQISNGKPGDSAFFDTVQFLRNSVHPTDPENRVLVAGRVNPLKDEVQVILEVDGARHSTKTRQGYFFFPGLVRKGSIVTVYALPEDGGARYPTMGRSFEANRNEVELLIPLEDRRDARLAQPLQRVQRGMVEYDADAGMIYKPRSLHINSGIGTPQEFQNKLQVNNLGFLDRDRRYDNPDKARRLLFFGNCNLFGHSVPRHNHVNVLLESLLSQRLGYPVEIPTFASSGHSYGRYWAYYQHFGKQFSPEIVCLFLQSGEEVLECEPDAFAEFREYDVKHLPSHLFRSRPDGSLEQLEPDFEYYRYVGKDPARKARRAAEREQNGAYFMDGVDWLTAYHQVSPPDLPPRAQAVWDHFERVTRFYRDEYRKNGSKMLIVLTPEVQLGYLRDRTQWTDKEGRIYDAQGFSDRLRALCDQLGIGFCDAPAYIRPRHPKVDLFSWRFDSHASPYGFEWVAEAVFQYLLTTRFLEDLPAGKYALAQK